MFRKGKFSKTVENNKTIKIEKKKKICKTFSPLFKNTNTPKNDLNLVILCLVLIMVNAFSQSVFFFSYRNETGDSTIPDYLVQSIATHTIRQNSLLLTPGAQCRICLRAYSAGQVVKKLPCRHEVSVQLCCILHDSLRYDFWLKYETNNSKTIACINLLLIRYYFCVIYIDMRYTH